MPTPSSYRTDPAAPSFPDDRPIIVFDGHCVLCSRFARLVLRRDRAGRFRLLPAPIRDAAYGLVARNRLRWFGRREACDLAEPGLEDRFLS